MLYNVALWKFCMIIFRDLKLIRKKKSITFSMFRKFFITTSANMW